MLLSDNFDHYYVRPELVYLNSDGNVDEKDGETKNFTNLNPLVLYTYKNEESDQEQDEDCPDYIVENVETEIVEQEEEVEQKFVISNQNGQELLNGVEGGDEDDQLVEPMMPFFLTDPSVFTILNEHNEVGVSKSALQGRTIK